MTTVYKVLGRLEDGTFCSAVLRADHPMSMRYKLGKTTRAPKNLPIMAFKTLDQARAFCNAPRDKSTAVQYIATCEAKIQKLRGNVLYVPSLASPTKIAHFITAPRDLCSYEAPTGTVFCETLKVIRLEEEYSFSLLDSHVHGDKPLSRYKASRTNFLKRVNKCVRNLTSQ